MDTHVHELVKMWSGYQAGECAIWLLQGLLVLWCSLAQVVHGFGWGGSLCSGLSGTVLEKETGKYDSEPEFWKFSTRWHHIFVKSLKELVSLCLELISNKMPSKFLVQYFFNLLVSCCDYFLKADSKISNTEPEADVWEARESLVWKYDLQVCDQAKKAALPKPWLSNFYTTHFHMQTSKARSRKMHTNKKGDEIQFRVTPFSVQSCDIFNVESVHFWQ